MAGDSATDSPAKRGRAKSPKKATTKAAGARKASASPKAKAKAAAASPAKRGKKAAPVTKPVKGGKKAAAALPKKAAKKKKDPNAPKRNMTAFFFFGQANREAAKAALKAEGAEGKITEVASKLGEMWRNCSQADKAKYEELAAKDRIRYDKAKAAYEKTKK